MDNNLSQYVLFLADNNLILSHRLSELCGHAPGLEEDIALANISLDLLGQSRLFYEYAGKLLNQTADELVYFRDERQFYNLCLVELPQPDYAHTMLILHWYSSFYYLLLTTLTDSSDSTLAAIANKSLLEITNHKSHSRRWVETFAHGTLESQNKLKSAINQLSPYLDSLFVTNGYDQQLINSQITSDLTSFKEEFFTQIKAPLNQVGQFDKLILEAVPIPVFGNQGYHSEHLGYILTNLQHLAQQHPGANW